MNSSLIIRLTDVSKVFENKFVKTTAVCQANMTINAGDFVSIRGPSGSGKSTLLSLLGLLTPPTSGKMTHFDHDISNTSATDRAHLRNTHIGFVFQSYNLIDELPVIDNVLLPTTFTKGKPDRCKQRAMDLLERVGLGHRVRHYPAELSGGQQQRVAIARALMMQPDIILADEPTGNLDSESAEQIMQLLVEVNGKGTALVIVTHSSNVAELAQAQYEMSDGKLAPSGDCLSVITSPTELAYTA